MQGVAIRLPLGVPMMRLVAWEDHLVVSNSLRIWDLRKGWSSEPIIFRDHTDGVSRFYVWGQGIISISKNKSHLYPDLLMRKAVVVDMSCIIPTLQA